MSDQISFKDNIASLEKALQFARAELAELEERSQAYDLKTQEAREALDSLRRSLRGEVPRTKSRRGAGSVGSLPLNPDTGRPPRGARRDQVETICRKLGRGNQSFRTVDVLNVLREVEGELSQGMKSYTYAVMSTLESENIVTKVGRGKWTLTP